MESAVVIPIFKNQLDPDEILSLRQCLKILTPHPIIFAAPESLPLANYERICQEHHTNFLVETFNNSNFSSIQAYNKLMLSVTFYRRFQAFDYILIYQLDSYVFTDQFDYWCNKGFDFIGAPWFEGRSQSDENSDFLRYAGNGGFSLRKVQAIIQVLETKFKYVRKFPDLVNNYRLDRRFISLLLMPYRRFRIKNISYFFIRHFYMNEDSFFVFHAPSILPKFKVAGYEDAIHFAFECQPKRLYNETNGTLPFGCHAWRRYDAEFWSEFINVTD